MVVLASDTITAPLLPRNINFRRRIYTTNNIANTWPTKVKIIFALCIVSVIVVVFSFALFMHCRRRRLARLNDNRTSAMAMNANQFGSRSFQPEAVKRANTQMDEDLAAGRFSEQSGPGMYGRGSHEEEEKGHDFVDVPLGGGGGGGGYPGGPPGAGYGPPAPPQRIHEYGQPSYHNRI